MGLGGIVVNGVAGLEELDLVADLDFHFTFEDEKELLAACYFKIDCERDLSYQDVKL